MRRILIVGILVCLACFPAVAGEKRLIVPDTTTILGAQGATAGQVVIYDPDTQQYSLDTSLTVPGTPVLDAVHKMSNPGEFLFSTEVPLPATSELGQKPTIAGAVQWSDVIHSDGAGTYTRFFCPANLLGDDGDGANLDALYLDGGDNGDLVISLDRAVSISAVNYPRTTLLRFQRTGPGCQGWQFHSCEFEGDGMDPAHDVVGASGRGDDIAIALNVQGSLTPSSGGHNPYNPNGGEVAAFNKTSGQYSLIQTFASFPTTQNPAASEARINSIAAPPLGCTAIGGATTSDGVVDLCGVSWVTAEGGFNVRIEWVDLGAALQYKVLRGTRNDLCTAGLALVEHLITPRTYFIETEDPPPGETFVYLIQGLLPAEGELGCAQPPGVPTCEPTCTGPCMRNLISPGSCP